MKFIKKFQKGMGKTRQNLGSKLGYLFRSKKSEAEFFDELEEIFISSDVGIETSSKVAEDFRKYCSDNSVFGKERIKESFVEFLASILIPGDFILNEEGLTVLMLLGANGSGKTTTAAKIAGKFKTNGKKVMFAAADTFRAAAVEQLHEWAERIGIPIIKQQQGADPGAVVFDAMISAVAKNIDLLIIDTAGRFHNKVNLTKELQKIDKIIKSKIGDNKYMKFAVLDATAGSNSYTQAEVFNESMNLDGVVITKMDSSARGGVTIAVSYGLGLPVYMVGVGEKPEDLIPFEPDSFAASLF